MAKIGHIKGTNNVIYDVGYAKVIKGMSRDNESFDDLLIPLDTVFEDGCEYIIEVEVQTGSETTFYKSATLRFRLESIIVNGNTGGNGDKVTYYFSCSNAPSNYLLPELEEFDGMCNYYSYVKFSTLNGSPVETFTKSGVTYWCSDKYTKQTGSNYKLNSLYDSLDENKLNRTGDKLQTIVDQTNFESDSTSYGIDMKNSSIVNVNAINFNDTCDYNAEAINFKRSNGNWDSLLALDGTLKFIRNRTNGGNDGSSHNIAFSVGYIKIAAGTKVFTPSVAKYVQVFTNAQLNTLLGATNCSASNTVVYAMNGDFNAMGKYFSGCVNQGNNWFIQTNDSTNVNASPTRINYIVIKFA